MLPILLRGLLAPPIGHRPIRQDQLLVFVRGGCHPWEKLCNQQTSDGSHKNAKGFSIRDA
ncbi:MAG TPA: hypothetical protein EYQ23_04160 [Verrucomicrobiales bacterium]|nr:hypothetical protein [Verrucomicrobiales bacterium]